jgi:hypothetical protein
MEASTHMVQFQAARQALAHARTVDEIKDVRDKAEAIRMYLRQAGESLEMQNDAAEIKLRAERRMGEMLGEMGLHGGDRKSKSHDANLKLKDLDIKPDQSSRYQRIASVPEESFEFFLQHLRNGRKEITSAAALRFASSTVSEVESPTEPEAWSLFDGTEELKRRLRIILEKWPAEYIDSLGHQLKSLGEEILETGELA